MATEFRLPTLGENIEAGDVVNVLVAVGDTVEPDQPILEIETDKATIEVPTSVAGTIKEVHVSEGETVHVGQVILTVEEAGPPSSAAKPQSAQEIKEKVPDMAPAADTAEGTPAQPETREVEVGTQAEEVAPQTVELKLPELGENIETGDIVSVLVSVGDTIKSDQPILEIETDKATIEVPATAGGTVTEIHVNKGEKVQVGQLILTLQGVAGEPERKPPERPRPAEEAAAPPRREPAQQAPSRREGVATEDVTSSLSLEERIPPPDREIKPEPGRSAVPAAPNVRRLAREIGVDITRVRGTGPGDRVSMDDVKRYARQQGGGAVSSDGRGITLPDFSRWGEVDRQPMSNIRRTTAERLSQAWLAVPHVTQFDQADIGEMENLRKRFSPRVEAAGGKLTVTAILLKIVTAVLKEFPQVNASVDMDKKEVVYKKYYHIGVAVDTDRGLLVPVIRDVDKKSIIELAVELGDAAEKARSRKLALEDMQGGTFTITNLGGIGGTNFTPIVNAPEVAILGVARGRVEPVYRNGQFEPRLMLPLALSYDHRLIDGADGIRFLQRVVEYLEQPFLTSLQGW